MSYYFDKECNRILTGKSGVHAVTKHNVRLYEKSDVIIFLGHAYWKGHQRVPKQVEQVIAKLEEVAGRKATQAEIDFIKKI